MKMGKYDYDYLKVRIMIRASCFALHEHGLEVTFDEFAEQLQNHPQYEKIPLSRLVKYCYRYFKRRVLYGPEE